MRALTRGLIAGAAGTTALDAVSYLDMVVPGRPASTTPQRRAQRLAELMHVDLGKGEQGDNHASGLGALLGYATGAGVGMAYCLFTGGRGRWPLSAVVLSGLALVASNTPMTLLGVTDPREWMVTDWVADVVPHLA